MSKIIAITCSRVIIVLCGLLSLTMMAKLMSSESIGYYYYIVAISAFFSTVIFTPFGSYSEYLISEKKWHENEIIIGQWLIAIVISVICIVLASILYLVFNVSSKAFIIALFFGLLTFLYTSSCHVLNVSGRQLIAAVFSAIGPLLSVVLIFSTSFYIELEGIDWLYCILSSYMLMTLLITVYLLNSEVRIENKNVRSIIQDSLSSGNRLFLVSVIGVTTLVWVQQQGYKIVLEEFGGLELLGVISYCLAISSAAYSALDTIFQQIFLPNLFQAIKEDSTIHRKIKTWDTHFATLQFFTNLTMAIGIVLLSKVAMTYIGGGVYQDYWYVVAAGGVLEFIRSNINSYYLMVRLIKQANKAIFCNVIIAISVIAMAAMSSHDISENLFISMMLICYLTGYLALFISVKPLRKNIENIEMKILAIVISLVVLISHFTFADAVGDIVSSLFFCVVTSVIYLGWFFKNRYDYL